MREGNLRLTLQGKKNPQNVNLNAYFLIVLYNLKCSKMMRIQTLFYYSQSTSNHINQKVLASTSISNPAQLIYNVLLN